MPEPYAEFTPEQILRSMEADAQQIIVLRKCLAMGCEKCQKCQRVRPSCS